MKTFNEHDQYFWYNTSLDIVKKQINMQAF
jgi:hypothetical protein